MWAGLTVLAGCGAFLSFAWGLKAHFLAEGGMPRGMRHLSMASTAAFVLFAGLTVWQGVGQTAGIIAITLFLVASLIFWWAVQTTKNRPPAVAYSNNIPAMIYTDGPYAYVRHPFYLAYCLGWIATAIAGGPIQWIPAALIIGWYYKTARDEEAHFAASSVAEEYARYRRKTGLILPFIL